MKELINSIALKHQDNGFKINNSATEHQLKDFEKIVGFKLPEDFKKFYSISNGFECEEDIFNMIQLENIVDVYHHYGENWFYFCEYMIFSDMWGIRLNEINNRYEIFNGSYPEKTMTNSLSEFLEKFLKGDVFEKGGLYDWHKELGINK